MSDRFFGQFLGLAAQLRCGPAACCLADWWPTPSLSFGSFLLPRSFFLLASSFSRWPREGRWRLRAGGHAGTGRGRGRPRWPRIAALTWSNSSVRSGRDAGARAVVRRGRQDRRRSGVCGDNGRVGRSFNCGRHNVSSAVGMVAMWTGAKDSRGMGPPQRGGRRQWGGRGQGRGSPTGLN